MHMLCYFENLISFLFVCFPMLIMWAFVCVCLPDALCYVMWVLDIQVYVTYVKYNGRTLLFVFDKL